jgi:hypothetical protein
MKQVAGLISADLKPEAEGVAPDGSAGFYAVFDVQF